MLLLALLGLAPFGCSTKSGAGLRLPEGDPHRGREVFVEMSCHSCHRVFATDLPTPVADPPVPVIGGGVTWIPTDGQLVSSIINPNHRITRARAQQQVTVKGVSRMGSYNELMTVEDLVDLVAFLRTRYDVPVMLAEAAEPR